MACRNRLASVLICGLLVHAAPAQTITFRFHPLPPGPPNAKLLIAHAINDEGNIVGGWQYDPASGTRNSFYLNSASNEYTTIGFTGSGYTVARGINNRDEIVGFYGSSRDPAQLSPGDHGFIFRGGEFRTVDYPKSAGTRLYAINDAGDAVGQSINLGESTNRYVGFIYTKGQFRTLTCPDGEPASPAGINHKGQVVGSCRGGTGFLLSGDAISLIDFRAPLDAWIVPNAINNNGDIVGWYFVGKERHGFLLTAGSSPKFITVDNGWATFASGINSKGQIVVHSDKSFVGEPHTGTPPTP